MLVGLFGTEYLWIKWNPAIQVWVDGYLESLKKSDLFVELDIVGLEIGDLTLKCQELGSQSGLLFLKFLIPLPETLALGLQDDKAVLKFFSVSLWGHLKTKFKFIVSQSQLTPFRHNGITLSDLDWFWIKLIFVQLVFWPAIRLFNRIESQTWKTN